MDKKLPAFNNSAVCRFEYDVPNQTDRTARGARQGKQGGTACRNMRSW